MSSKSSSDQHAEPSSDAPPPYDFEQDTNDAQEQGQASSSGTDCPFRDRVLRDAWPVISEQLSTHLGTTSMCIPEDEFELLVLERKNRLLQASMLSSEHTEITERSASDGPTQIQAYAMIDTAVSLYQILKMTYDKEHGTTPALQERMVAKLAYEEVQCIEGTSRPSLPTPTEDRVLYKALLGMDGPHGSGLCKSLGFVALRGLNKEQRRNYSREYEERMLEAERQEKSRIANEEAAAREMAALAEEQSARSTSDRQSQGKGGFWH